MERKIEINKNSIKAATATTTTTTAAISSTRTKVARTHPFSNGHE
jgi:hypothetical protein